MSPSKGMREKGNFRKRNDSGTVVPSPAKRKVKKKKLGWLASNLAVKVAPSTVLRKKKEIL